MSLFAFMQLALVGAFCLVLADAASVLVAHQTARAAADAAALAAAASQWRALAGGEPSEAASRIASAAGASLESCECVVRGSRATVRVRVSTRVRTLRVGPAVVHASATARADPAAMFRAPGG